MVTRLAAHGLSDIVEKLGAGTRLTLDDGVRLFECPDLHAIGWLANREREKRHGATTYYNFNLRLEATNVCTASCLFCSFARLKPGDSDAYTMSLEQVLDKLRQRADQPLTEVHVVNGLHPDLPLSYYTDLLSGLKRVRPGIHLKCFTAVEIAFFADTYGMTDEAVLRAFIAAGLVLQRARAHHVVDALGHRLDVAVEHRHVGAQPEPVRELVNRQIAIGVGFVVRDLLPHPRREDLRAAAR